MSGSIQGLDIISVAEFLFHAPLRLWHNITILLQELAARTDSGPLLIELFEQSVLQQDDAGGGIPLT